MGIEDGRHTEATAGSVDGRAVGLRLARHTDLLAPVWDHRVTLVVGPAGSGKSTLVGRLAQEARTRGPVAVHRPAVDEQAAPATLSALRSSVLAAVGRSDQGRPWADAAEALRQLARLPTPLVVVVDDAHLLEGSAAGDALHALLVDGPRQVRWVVASRREPAQDLSGLRLAGDLHEVRADDLRFRAWEVEQLFTHWYGQPLPPEEMAELARVSEGWVAGLHLFHLATADRPPATRRRILRSLGTRATVRDYLSRNVLDHLSPPMRAFLVHTSPLDLLTGPLCDALLEREGSRDVLRELHASSLFTHEVGDDAWRYHDVFGSFLRALLEEELGAEEAAARHRRAGDILADAGQGDSALVAYSRAQAWGPMLAHLRATGADPDPRGGGWVGALPASLVADPVVALAVARAQVTQGELARALDAYRSAEAAGLPGPLRGPARRERSAVASWVTDEASPPPGWVALAHAAVRHDPRRASRDALQLGGDHGRLVAGLLAVLAGDLERSIRLLGQVDASPDATPAEHALAALALSTVEVIYGRGDRDIRRCAGEADALGVGWVSEIARSFVVVADPAAPVERVAAVMRRRREAGDPVGAAIAAVVVVLGRIVHEARPDPRRPGGWRGRGPQVEAVWSAWLDDAAHDARRAGATTLEAWARAIGALLSVRRTEPEARAAALAAEHLARSAEVPGARAVAFAALGASGGPSAAEHLRLAEDLASSCLGGLPAGFRRMIDWSVAPARSTAVLDPLLGRQRELDDLVRSWRRADREGLAVRVTGHAGSGISTLLVHLAEHVRDRGGPVVWLDGSASRSDPVWTAIAGRWPTEAGPLAWSDDAGWVDVDVAAAVEDAATALGAAPDAEAAASALRTVIELSGRVRPVLLVVDHVRLLDPSGRDLLAALLRDVRDLPLMVVVGHRSPTTTDMRGLTPTEVWLDPLDHAALVELLHARGLPSDAAAVESLVALTGGMPALVHEVLVTVRSPSTVRTPHDVVGVPWDPGRVPRGARRVADGQLDDLDAGSGEVLRAAAVLGPDVDVDCLAAVLGRHRAEVERAVGRAVDVGLLRRIGDGGTRFSVPAVTAHLAAAVDDAGRIALLRAAADHHAAADVPDVDAEARHLLAVASIDRGRVEVRRLADVAARAVDRSVARGDVEAAVGLGSVAVGLIGDGAAAGSTIALQLSLARAHRFGGDGAASREALRAAARGALARDEEDSLLDVALEVAIAASEGGLDPDDVTVLDRATDAGGAPTGRRLVLSAWLAAHRPTGPSPDVDGVASLADDACSWAQSRDPRLAALALSAWHDTQWDAASRPARATTARGMAAAAQRAGEVDLALTASRLARAAALEGGDAVGADVELARYLRIADDRPGGPVGWWVAAARAGRALLDGRFDDAEERLATAGPDVPRSAALLRRVHDAVVRRDAGGATATGPGGDEPSGGAGDEDVAIQLAERALDAWVAARSGDAAAAQVEVARFVSSSLAEVPIGPRWLPTMVWLAEAAAVVRDVDRAAALSRELLPWAGHLVVVETALVWGSADHALGRLALVLGSHDDAVAHLDDAVDLAQRLGSLTLSATAQLDAGRARLERDGPGDRAQARVLLATALDSARSAGMAGVVAEGERLLAVSRPPVRLGAVAPRGGATGAADVPTASDAVTMAAMAPRVAVRCLGPFELVIDEHIIDLGRVRPRARSVLWYLAMSGGELVNRQQLAAALWSDKDEASARRGLQVAVSSLRTASSVEGWAGRWSLIDRDADAYRLALGPSDTSDVESFHRALDWARSVPAAGRAVALEEALALYRGDLLPEAGPAEWVVGERQRLQLAAAEAALEAARIRFEEGDLAAAVRACEKGIAADRYRDALWLLLVEVREAQGDRAAASRARSGHAAMLAELGL